MRGSVESHVITILYLSVRLFLSLGYNFLTNWPYLVNFICMSNQRKRCMFSVQKSSFIISKIIRKEWILHKTWVLILEWLIITWTWTWTKVTPYYYKLVCASCTYSSLLNRFHHFISSVSVTLILMKSIILLSLLSNYTHPLNPCVR